MAGDHTHRHRIALARFDEIVYSFHRSSFSSGSAAPGAAVMASEEAGDVYRDGRTYDVRVWGTTESRNSVDDVGRLLIDTPSGEQVALSEVADVRIGPTDNSIERENQSRRLDVGANAVGSDRPPASSPFSGSRPATAS